MGISNMDIRNPGYHFKKLIEISSDDRSICTYIFKCQILEEEIYCFLRFCASATTCGEGGLDVCAS
jgi:hypothetical protein